MVKHFSAIVFVAGISLAFPVSSQATTYYVDSSCSNPGNGLVDQCASSPGAAGAYNTATGSNSLQTALSAAVAGDTVLIKTGSAPYVTNYRTGQGGSIDRAYGGFHIDHSGLSGKPITVKSYPGNTPVLAACANPPPVSCELPTITAGARSFITLDGLKIVGVISLFGDDAPPQYGNVIKNCDISVGDWGIGTGNWTALYISHESGFLAQNNNIHDIVIAGDAGMNSPSCFKLYYVDHSIFEYNTCKHQAYALENRNQFTGIEDKVQSSYNIHRYNWIEDTEVCIWLSYGPMSNTQIYGNVCISSTGSEAPGNNNGNSFGNFVRLTEDADGVDIHNNTVYGFAVCLNTHENYAHKNILYYNNICNSARSWNFFTYNTTDTIPATFALVDYNSYTPGLTYIYPNQNTYANLAAWQAATGVDGHSREGDCAFVDPGKDFHLSGTSICRASGRVGGRVTGAVMEAGAYGVTSCVGQGCTGLQQPAAPAAPTNLRIVP